MNTPESRSAVIVRPVTRATGPIACARAEGARPVSGFRSFRLARTSRRGATMSKWSLVAVSLVPAAVGGFLCYLMVMTFLQRAETLNGTLMGLAGVTLAISALIAVMPLAIAVFMSNTGPQYVEVPAEGASEPTSEAEDFDDLDYEADDFDVAHEADVDAIDLDDNFDEGFDDDFDDELTFEDDDEFA
ncbi:MAG: hypothetical protein D6725_16095 [Planctomycetota bacterium]|nr:MAG: hypothetical protein D6725_16095 [Planctomycetota bacterium]